MNYLRSVFAELKNITWLTGSQTRRDASTVVVVSLFFAAFLGFIDWVFQTGITNLSK